MPIRKKTPEAVAIAVKLRLEGKSLLEIGKMFGVSGPVIYAWTKHQMPVREKPKPKPKRQFPMPDWGDAESQSRASKRFKGHRKRLAEHAARIREYLRTHPEEAHGTTLEEKDQ